MTSLSRRCLNTFMLGALLLALPVFSQQAEEATEPITTVTSVMWLSDDSQIEDAEAVLTRMEHGIAMTMDVSGLTPGDVYTIWWVIFNLPMGCSDGDCGQDDVFLMNREGSFILDGNDQRQLNRPSIEALQIANQWAAGSIVDQDGSVKFEGHLPIGDTFTDVDFGFGLLYPVTAEIHLIARSHGAVQAGLLHEQLLTAWGGCPNPNDRAPCMDMFYARFAALP